MHDPGHPLYLPLRTLHILGAMILLGGLAAALHLKLTADRAGDPAYAAKLHAKLRKLDGALIGPGVLLTFAAGYAMVRFLGGRIAQHAFVLTGLITMTVAVLLWYFGVRRLGDKLADEAEACQANRQPLSPQYAKWSAGWVATAAGSVLFVVITTVIMVWRIPGG